jgi:small subunit ribosomal protein S14
MAKVSMIERDTKRKKLAKTFSSKRKALKSTIMNRELSMEERFAAQLELNKLPRDSSRSRQRNRCVLTGRPRGFYRKFQLSRIALRDLASLGQIPGVIKSSW